MTRRVSFPKVKAPVPYGRDLSKAPVLYVALTPIVAEAEANNGTSSWRSANGQPASQLRSAAKAHGYRVNISKLSGDDVFRLNGRLPEIEAS